MRTLICGLFLSVFAVSMAQQKSESKAEVRLEQKSETKSKGVVGCQQYPVRFVYLNGKNIGSVKNQQLENVKVFVDESGNINITAPHYDVQQDSSYHPLFASEIPSMKGMIDKKAKPLEQSNSKPIDGEISPVETLKPISP